jgi:hypothetical protein
VFGELFLYKSPTLNKCHCVHTLLAGTGLLELIKLKIYSLHCREVHTKSSPH